MKLEDANQANRTDQLFSLCRIIHDKQLYYVSQYNEELIICIAQGPHHKLYISLNVHY